MSLNIHPYYFSWSKRIFDIVLAIVLLICSLPILFTISIISFIKPGLPIIFKQKRTGKNGKEFTIYKFRTMEKNAYLTKHKYLKLNEAPWPMFKIHNDPRFVGAGRILSRTGLDELPQLINIIKGEMSFVGPRPLPTKEAIALSKEWKNFREKVKPGIFSLWAISKNRHKNLKTWEQLEIETLVNSSVKMDFLLITKTIFYQLLSSVKKNN